MGSKPQLAGCRVQPEAEYAYGPAAGLPDTKVGELTQSLYEKAQKDGWIVISMKCDWRRVFSFIQ